MVQEKEHNKSTEEEERNKTDPKDENTLDPLNDPLNDETNESESLPYEESESGTNDSQPGGTDDSEESDSVLPKRGPRFRKQLLKKIPLINYPNKLEFKKSDMESWLATIINLKASDYLESLQRLVSQKNL